MFRKYFYGKLLNAFAGLVLASVFIGGCASTDEYGDGRHDVDEYDSLKLSMKLPPPGGITLQGGGLRQVTLSWPAPAEDIFRYRIERAEEFEGPFKFVAYVDPQLKGYVDGAQEGLRLNDSTTYFYRVVTVLTDDGPRSLPCKVMSATTGPPPGPVREVRVHASGSRKNSLSWSSAEGAGALTYRVERASDERPDLFAPVGTTSENVFVDGGTTASTLKDSSEYRYRVVTMNEVGSESGPSEVVEVKTLPPPAPVAGLEGVSGEVRCVPLKWNPSPEMDIIEYHISCARDPEGPFEKLAAVEGRTTTAYLHGGTNPGDLEDEATYYYRIVAVNSVGAVSAPGESVRVVTRHIPPVVEGVEVQSGRPREVPVSWQPSTDTAVVGYEIWRSLEGEDDWQQIRKIEDAKTIRYLDRGGEDDTEKLGVLLDGTNYAYRVIAFNTGGVRSSASAPVTATTKVVPATPAGLTASSGLAGVIKLSWNSNPEKDIKGYQVEVSSRESRGFDKLCFVDVVPGATTLKAEESGLDVNKTRYYRVKALDVEGLESLWCAAVSGISKPLPDPPSSLQLTEENDAVTLRWLCPPQNDIVKYNVWSKRLIGWKLLGENEKAEYVFDKTALKDIASLAVTAIDKDGLESEKSETIKQTIVEK